MQDVNSVFIVKTLPKSYFMTKIIRHTLKIPVHKMEIKQINKTIFQYFQ